MKKETQVESDVGHTVVVCLDSGVKLVAEIVAETKKQLILVDVLEMMLYSDPVTYRSGFSLVEMLPLDFVESDTIMIPKKKILTKVRATQKLVDFYDKSLSSLRSRKEPTKKFAGEYESGNPLKDLLEAIGSKVQNQEGSEVDEFVKNEQKIDEKKTTAKKQENDYVDLGKEGVRPVPRGGKKPN